MIARRYEKLLAKVRPVEKPVPDRGVEVLESLVTHSSQRLGDVLPLVRTGKALPVAEPYTISTKMVLASPTAPPAAFSIVLDDDARRAELVLVASPDAIERADPAPSALALSHVLGTR